MGKWIEFFFDGNSWFGVVDSPATFKKLLAAYEGDLATLFDRARRAPVEEIRELPWYYTPGRAQLTRTGEMPNFGFRREHIGGKQTLGEWLKENNVDLAEAVPQ